MTVPNSLETARFYGRIFNPQLFREREDENRLYVTTGTAYLAFGGNPKAKPVIDHFCTLVEGYNAREVRPKLEAAGIRLTPGGFGMLLDPDQLRLQLLNVPGGLAGSIMPAGRISLEPPAVHALAIDHIMLRVSDLASSTEHYRKLFGREASRQQNPARVWFNVANTRLGMQPVASGEEPAVDHFSLTVVAFNREEITRKLKQLGVELAPSNDEKLLRFRDPHGFIVELKPAGGAVPLK
jgi:catechol 2,3-dioxygenase-like lactoylglutathione lyase family enzyme